MVPTSTQGAPVLPRRFSVDIARLSRKICPMVLVGLGIVVWQRNRACWRKHVRKMEQRQEEVTQLLREIRDSLKAKS